MSYRFMAAHRHQHSLAHMCQTLGISRSGYYAWRRRQPSRREVANQALLVHIRAIHAESRQTYGGPRIHAELNARGWHCNRKRVERLMRLHHVRARRKRRRQRTTQVDTSLPVAPNRLNRDFRASAPNRKWLSDLTYVPTAEGWLYLATVMDLYSRRIVGWAMDTTLAAELPETALRMALATRRPAAGLVHHSDRGSQYACAGYQALLTTHHILPSMSRTGNCYDNAPMESFFGTLKSEWLHHQHYRTRAEARRDIFAYIEGFYNTTRRHSALGYHSPAEFERLTAPVS